MVVVSGGWRWVGDGGGKWSRWSGGVVGVVVVEWSSSSE